MNIKRSFLWSVFPLVCVFSFFLLAADEARSLNQQSLTFNMVVTYWNAHNRAHEFAVAFLKNVQNPLIKKIYVFYENFSGQRPLFMQSEKIEIVPIAGIPHHKDFFEFANTRLSGELVIMANADIFFDATLKLLKDVDLTKYVVALTRYEYVPDGWKNHPCCHDSWIVRSPIRYVDADHRFNWFGTEHLLLNSLIQCGYQIINPRLSIKTWHVHASRWRDPQVKIGYGTYPHYSLPFHTLNECLALPAQETCKFTGMHVTRSEMPNLVQQKAAGDEKCGKECKNIVEIAV